MNIDDWFAWPTKSTDPGVNFVVIVVLTMLAIAALVLGAAIIIPVLIVIGIAKGIHWYVNRPTPTADLYQATQQRVAEANFPETNAFLTAHLGRVLEACGNTVPTEAVFDGFVPAARALYDAEDLSNQLPPLPPVGANTIEEGRYRDRLLTRMRKIADPNRTLDVINRTLGDAFVTFVKNLPPVAQVTPEEFAEEPPPFATVPLLDVLPDTGHVVLDIMAAFNTAELDELGLFSNLRRQFERNVHDASGVPYPAPAHKLVFPTDYKGSPYEIVSAYLRNTPFEPLFYAAVSINFPDVRRYEHMHVIGGSGHGKTQLLQHLIFHDLTRSEPPALIVIDSQGEMLRKVQDLALFAPGQPLSERLIVIDPEDVEFPPALNMFDMTNARLAGYSAAHREQIEAGVIELYNYIFGALAAELTQKQGTAFAYVARLMLSIPGSTIHTLRELMEDAAPNIEQSPFAEHIYKLDSTSQAFFQNQFFTKSFAQTRQQIARRLYGVLQVPSFDRMFSSKTNKLDVFDAMQAGKVVLVNTSKALLKSDASALFGRYMIALTIRAAFERVAVSTRNPAFLIVDEAAEYFDENLETLLSQARKFNLGVLFAHQHLDQLSTALRSSVAANTSIKLAGGVSDRDARALAPDMRTTADFITSMRKHQHSTEFACYIRNTTSNAVRLQIPFGTMEAAPRMSPDASTKLVGRNRERYAASRDTPRPVATGPDMASPAAPESPPGSTPGDDWRS